jgi:hypothetical protein
LTFYLFHEAAAMVLVNGSHPPTFIRRGVQQRCPLALYLFLIVAKILNAMMKEVSSGNVKGYQRRIGSK